MKLNVGEERTIAKVEKGCQELLGLFMIICRKSGNVWNVISLTNIDFSKSNIGGDYISTEIQKA